MGGRDKGNAAEREIAKMLEKWWSAVEPECKFVRVPLSGGWGGPAIRAGFRASGDVMTTAARFNLSVEVKRREGWKWGPLRAGKPSPVWGWWQQAIGQAVEMTAEPWLFFRHNREPWYLMMRDRLSVYLKLHRELEPACSWTNQMLMARAIRADAHPIVYLAEDVLRLSAERFADLGR